MNVRSRSSPINLSSLAEARHPAGIREALFVIRFGVIARSGIRRATASGSSAERRKTCYKPYKACKGLAFGEGSPSGRTRSVAASYPSPYYPACAHLRRRIDGELLPQVRMASDRSWIMKPCLATQKPSADGRLKLLVT
jgi:hypothetical protein